MSALSPEEYPVMLRTLVGSQAHGVARDGSDRDVREVFYAPTRDLLVIPESARPKTGWQSQPQRMVDDEGGYEVGHFLELAMRGNPNVVELLWTTVEESTPEGEGLRRLGLESVLGATPLVRAFLGYASNARDKIITDAGRHLKWQAIYVRVLATLCELLREGHIEYPITRYPWGEDVRALRDGEATTDHALNLGRSLESELKRLEGHAAIRREPDVEAVNAWLLDLRREHWSV